jgi:hypothetical protein
MGSSSEASAGDAGAILAGAVVGDDEGGLGDVSGEEMVLRAAAGEEWSRVPNVCVDRRCRESDRESD